MADDPLTEATLERFERLLSVQDPSFVELLQPGIEEAEIQWRLTTLGLGVGAAGPDVLAWWRWHDGIGPHTSVESPIGYLTFLPLQEAVERTAFYRSELADEVFPDARDDTPTRALDAAIRDIPGDLGWTSRSLVVMEGTNGDVVVVDTAADGMPVHRKGVTESMTAMPIASSLGELVRHWIVQLERGTRAGDLDADPLRGADDPLRLYPRDGA